MTIDAKLAVGIKHPKRVQAIAKVMCHSHFGYHRVALINNSIVTLDHKLNRQTQADWAELGGRIPRCQAALDCFKNMKMSGVPGELHKFLNEGKKKHNQRRYSRLEKYSNVKKEQLGGDKFSKMKYYVRMLLKHRCNYYSIKKGDLVEIIVFSVRSVETGERLDNILSNCNVWGMARRKYDFETNSNAAKRHPMAVDLHIGLVKNWRQKINHIALPVIEGHLVLAIYRRTDEKKFPTYTAQVLVEEERDIGPTPERSNAPGIPCHREWHFAKKWTVIQYRNGFWYLGAFADKCYSKWRPREIPTADGSVRSKAS